MKYRADSQIRFKTTLLRSNLCDYSDAYILVKGIITVVGAGAATAAIQADRNNKQAIFKNSAPFTEYITEVNNTQTDDARDLNVVMIVYNLIPCR